MVAPTCFALLMNNKRAYLTVPLESGNVRHEPVAKPHRLRRLKVGEAVRPETAQHSPRHETQHTGERKRLCGGEI